MRRTASAVLSGLVLAGSLSVAQAQIATPATPATPQSKSIAEQTMGTDHMMSKKEAEAAYADAKRHCKAMSGQERATCLQQAREDHKQRDSAYKEDRGHPKASQDMPPAGAR